MDPNHKNSSIHDICGDNSSPPFKIVCEEKLSPCESTKYTYYLRKEMNQLFFLECPIYTHHSSLGFPQ